MHFSARHRLHAGPDAVADTLADPDFYGSLTLPDLSPATVLEHGEHGGEALVRLRFVFVGQLDPLVTRLLAGHELAWIQEIRVERAARRGRILFAAERDPRRLHGEATFVLDATGTGCERSVEGDLAVAVPGIARMAERRVVPGIVTRLGIEAEALDARLAPRPG